LKLQLIDRGLFPDVAWKAFRSASVADGAVELAKAGRVDLVRVLLDRHYMELFKCLETSSFVDPLLIHFPPLSLENEAELISVITDLIVPKASELSDLADFCVTRARAVADQDPQLGLDWLNVTLKPSPHSNALNSPLETIRSLVHASERFDIESKISPLFSIVQTLVTLAQDFAIHYPRVSLAALETDTKTCLTSIAAELITDLELIDVFESFVGKFNTIDRDDVILDRIKVLKNTLKGTTSMDDETADISLSPKRLRYENVTTDSVFDQITFLLPLISDPERLAEGIYESMIAVNANRFIASEKSFAFIASLSRLSPPTTFGYFSQLVVSYMAVQSVTASLIEFEEFQQVRDRPDFLMSKSNITMIVNKLCCEIGAVDKAISLGSVFPYIREEDCWMLRLASLFFGKESEERVAEIFNSLIADGDIRSMVARDFATMILNQNCRSVADLEFLDRVVLPFVEDEKLLRGFSQVFFLQSEFGILIALNEIAQKFEAISDFKNLMDNPNSIGNRCKMERAKMLFNFDESGMVDSATLELPPFRSASDVNEFLDSKCDRFLRRQSKIENLSVVCEHVLIPSLKAAAVVNRCDEVMGGFGWSASFVSNVENLSNPEKFSDVHFEFEDDSGDAVLVLANTAERKDMSKLDYLVADIREAGLVRAEIIQEQPKAGSGDVSRNRKFAVLSEWMNLFGSLGVEFDQAELLRACENDKLAIKNVLKTFLPKLIVKSKYDLKLCLDFLVVIGKPETGAVADLLVTYMMIMLETEPTIGSELEMKLRQSVSELIKMKNFIEGLNRVLSFVVPKLVRDEAKLAQFVDVVLDHKMGDGFGEFEKIKSILKKLELMNKIEGVNGQLKFERLVHETEKVLIDWLSGNAGCVEIVRETISLGRIFEVEEKVIMRVFEKIINFTELTILSGSVSIETVLILLENLSDSEREMIGKELVSKLPLSHQQLELVEYFSTSSWVAMDDVLLLRNRLLLRQHDLEYLEDVLVQESGVKKVIERLFTDRSEGVKNLDGVVLKLVQMNQINWDKFKLDACKRWLNVKDEAVVDLVRCGGMTEEIEEKLVCMLLRVFFSPEEKPGLKVSCFNVLMRGFRLSVVKRVYGKRTEDLIDIEKNLMYMDLLVGRKILKSDDLGYKEFHQLNKALIAKGLTKNSNKLEVLMIAAWIVADFGIKDFEIANTLKTRLMSHGIQGMEILHAITKQGKEEVNVTDYPKAFTSSSIEGIRTDDSENLVLN
jgi:hypothetical protein